MNGNGLTSSRVAEELESSRSRMSIDGYARIDLRLTPQNEVYFIEANPNPFLASDEDFAQSALKAGLSFRQLIERIVQLGLKAVRV